MKKYCFAAAIISPVIVLGVTAPASAADLAAKPYVKAPPAPVAPPIYDWSGFYIGGNAGYAWGSRCIDVTAISGVAVADTEGCRSAGGGVLGGQVGYRWQQANFVFGLEAQGDWANLRNSNASLLFPGDTWTTKTSGLGLFTGQIGYAWNNVLWYVKGGAAVAERQWDLFDTATGSGLAQFDRTRWGGTVGTGLEYGFTPNWSVAVEYDYLFRASDSQTILTPGLAPISSITANTRADANMLTVRFNYHFSGFGAPIAARY